jgi:hypothetical protein
MDGKLIPATIYSDTGEPCFVRYEGKTTILNQKWQIHRLEQKLGSDFKIHRVKENEHPSIALFFYLSFGLFLIRLVS